MKASGLHRDPHGNARRAKPLGKRPSRLDFSNNDGLFRVPVAAIQGTKVFERDDFYPMDAAIFWQNQRNRGGTPFALVSFL